MGYLLAKPSFFLAPYIKQYWALENCLPEGYTHIQRITPNGLMEMTFYLGDRPRSLNKSKALTSNSLVSGQQTKYYDLEVSGKLDMFSVTLKPQGAMILLNLPINEVTEQNVPLAFLYENDIIRLEDELHKTKSFEGRVRIIESFLLNRISCKVINRDFDRINNSILNINRLDTNASIESLASRACLSRKQYERIFHHCIGISPKRFQRIVRFQRAVHEKYLNPKLSLTQLAYNCGYYDQAHMVNDFKSLSGISPKKYFSECEVGSDYFSE